MHIFILKLTTTIVLKWGHSVYHTLQDSAGPQWPKAGPKPTKGSVTKDWTEPHETATVTLGWTKFHKWSQWPKAGPNPTKLSDPMLDQIPQHGHSGQRLDQIPQNCQWPYAGPNPTIWSQWPKAGPNPTNWSQWPKAGPNPTNWSQWPKAGPNPTKWSQ